jgi:hypothetical protein
MYPVTYCIFLHSNALTSFGYCHVVALLLNTQPHRVCEDGNLPTREAAFPIPAKIRQYQALSSKICDPRQCVCDSSPNPADIQVYYFHAE